MSIELAMTVARRRFTLQVETRIERGTVVAVLGPNGAGKSTLVRALAGLDAITSGTIAIDGTLVDDADDTFVAPQDRSVGVVFQDYALFPHLSVLENVAFGPRSRGVERLTAQRAAMRILERLGIESLFNRKPGQISGGQAQRVALARALASNPRVLLLDEPLAALDVEARAATRTHLLDSVRGFDGCVVIVTHDPLDAMLLADRVLILEDGRVVQDAPPAEIARRPATAYAASLMGVTLLRGRAASGELSLDEGGTLHIADRGIAGPVLAVIRPEAVSVHRERPEGSPRNVWQATVAAIQPSHDRVRIVLDGEPSVVATITPGAVAELGLRVGEPVWLSVKAVEIDVYRVGDDADVIVLAGGASRRLGQDKAQVVIGDRPAIEHVVDALPADAHVVVVGPDPGPLARHVDVTREDPVGSGPVAALAAGLELTSAPWVTVVAVDMPFVCEALAALQAADPSEVDALIAIDGDGREQYLCARYRATALRDALAGLPSIEGAAMRDLVKGMRTRTVPAPSRSMLDIDTPADLERARAEAQNTATID